MKRIAGMVLFLLFISLLGVKAQGRKEIALPNIPGYLTLKCDFHLHTVFSDGDVWPTLRVQEAWEEGLDAISITDHIEYRPHSQDMQADHNRPFEIAQPLANELGVILIRGAEITRKMPPGHLNALFVSNANLLDRESWWEACMEADEQGAFVFWNHPGWKEQQPVQTLWWKDHTRLHDAGILKGIEVVNGDEYYPEAHRWAKEKQLTMLANSDLHGPSSMEYGITAKKRPITLVFARSRTSEAIREALFDKRTAIYTGDKLMGDKLFLAPLFSNSIDVVSSKINLGYQQVKQIWIHNQSAIDFRLKQRQPSVGFSCPSEILLKANRTTLVELEGTSAEINSTSVLKMYYEVSNMLVDRTEALPVTIELLNK